VGERWNLEKNLHLTGEKNKRKARRNKFPRLQSFKQVDHMTKTGQLGKEVAGKLQDSRTVRGKSAIGNNRGEKEERSDHPSGGERTGIRPPNAHSTRSKCWR